jgi:hypothetical protein
MAADRRVAFVGRWVWFFDPDGNNLAFVQRT